MLSWPFRAAVGKNYAGWQNVHQKDNFCSNPEKTKLAKCSDIRLSLEQLKTTQQDLSQYIFELISLGNFFGMLSSICCDFVELNSDESSSSFSPNQCHSLTWASGEFLRQQLRLCRPWTGSQSPRHWRPSTAAADEPGQEVAGQVCYDLDARVDWPPLGLGRHEGCCPSRLGSGRQTHPEQKGCGQ